MSKEKVQSQNFHEKNQPKLKNYFWKRESSSQLGERKGPKGLRDIKNMDREKWKRERKQKDERELKRKVLLTCGGTMVKC